MSGAYSNRIGAGSDEVHTAELLSSRIIISGIIHNARLCQVERILSESAADIILIIDLDGNITYVSKTDDKETGYVREDILGRNIRDILSLARS